MKVKGFVRGGKREERRRERGEGHCDGDFGYIEWEDFASVEPCEDIRFEWPVGAAQQ